MDNFVPTNTLASTAFDVLKMDAVDDPLINVNKLATMDIEESYFSSAVSFIKECNKEITDYKITLYHNLSEATTEGVVLESFSDFFTKIKDIIDKFLKFIKSLFNRFVNTIMKMISSDKYITKNKKKLNDFKSEDNFEFNGYKYSFTPNIPLASAALSFNGNLFDELYASNVQGQLTVNGVRDVVANLNFDEDYDRFRAQVIGKDGESINVSEFSEELFKVFRSGELDTEKIEADRTVVMKSLDSFENFKKIKSQLEHDRSEIEKAYDKVKKQVSEIVKRNGDMNMSAFVNSLPDASNITSTETLNNDGFTMSGTMMTQIDMYIKAKTDQIQEYSNIHALAYGAKLDALKECLKQDKNVLYTALGRVMRTDSQREVK